MNKGFVVAVALLAINFPSWAGPQRKPTGAEKQKALNKNLHTIKGKLSALGSQLHEKRLAAIKLEGDVEWANQQMDKLHDKLDSAKERLRQSKKQQALVAEQLEAETEKLNVVKREIAQRVRGMYMGGNVSLLSVMVSTKSIGDFAARKSFMERIAKRDRELFAKAGEIRAQVLAKKKEKDAAVARTVGLTHDVANDMAAMGVIKKKKRQLLANVQAQKAQLEAAYDSLAEESKSIEKQIQAFQARTMGGGGGPIFSGRFRRPVSGPITSGFGSRYHPILHRTRMHTGVDFGAASGTPIHAAGSGIVISAGTKGGYGNCVIIDHGGGISTLYGHCSRIFVSEGQRVNVGDRIAAVGATGLATGPHLHFEVRVHGTPVNPMGHL